MIDFDLAWFIEQEIVSAQMDLAKVADIVIDLYAMTACLSRANRSYCLGLQNADHEVREREREIQRERDFQGERERANQSYWLGLQKADHEVRER